MTLELLASGLTDSAAYLYDHDSNRVAAAIGSVSTGYTYDRAGQLVSRVDGGSPTSFSLMGQWLSTARLGAMRTFAVTFEAPIGTILRDGQLLPGSSAVAVFRAVGSSPLGYIPRTAFVEP